MTAVRGLVSIKEASVVAGVTEMTVRNWIAGKGQKIQRPFPDSLGTISNIAVYDVDEVLAWAKDHGKQGTTKTEKIARLKAQLALLEEEVSA